MANMATTFSELFAVLQNPFVPPNAQYTGFEAQPAVQPQAILQSLESIQHPSALLAARMDGTPALYLAPFTAATLPGVAPPANKTAFYGDFSQAGNPPALLDVRAAFFHLTAAVSVLPVGDVAAAWTAAPEGDVLLAPPAAGVNAEQVITRNSMPVPHPYTQAVIDLNSSGDISWERLWDVVGVPVSSDPALLGDYQAFVDYLRVSSTQRPAAAVGGNVRDPATALNIVARNTTPALQDQAVAYARNFLPGLQQPTNLNAQMNQIAQNQALQTAALTNAQQQQDRPPTMARKSPALLGRVRLLCEVPENAPETDLAPFWQEFPGTSAGRWSGALSSVILSQRTEVASNNGPLLTAPILTTTLVTDVGEGNFFAENIDDVGSGLSILRIRPGNSTDALALTAQNRMHSLMVTGTGVAQASTVQMMVTNQEIEIPSNPFIFIAILQGYQLFVTSICGQYNRAVTNLYNNVVRNCNELVRQISARYPEESTFTYVALLIESFIFRKMNRYIMDLMSSPPVAVLGGGTIPCPDFMEIRDALENATLMNLTEMPRAIATNVNPFVSPQVPSTADTPPLVKGPKDKESIEGRQQLSHPEWNQNLKRAWTTLGHEGLWKEGSPFRDESKPNKKRVIPSDTPGKRICLSMALNGFCYSNCGGLHRCLNSAEVNRVAEAGGMTLE